jgi:hypothetical protein
MERHRLTAEQAFGVLARISQEMNRKLVDIARELTDTGTMARGPSPARLTPPGFGGPLATQRLLPDHARFATLGGGLHVHGPEPPYTPNQRGPS